jgi:hypothetical protein
MIYTTISSFLISGRAQFWIEWDLSGNLYINMDIKELNDIKES